MHVGREGMPLTFSKGTKNIEKEKNKELGSTAWNTGGTWAEKVYYASDILKTKRK
jgi:hypothetical protein